MQMILNSATAASVSVSAPALVAMGVGDSARMDRTTSPKQKRERKRESYV